MKQRRIYGVVNASGAGYPGRAMITGRAGAGRFWAVMLSGQAAGWECIISREQIEEGTK